MPAKNETGWLIEFPADERGALYYGKTIHGLGTTAEHMDAIRFARRQDANLIIEEETRYSSFRTLWDQASALEHMWMACDRTEENER